MKKNDLPEEWKKVWDTFLDLHSNKHKQKQKNSWIRKMGLLNLDFGYVLPYCELTFWQRYNCRVSNYHIFPPRNLNLVSVLRKMYCGFGFPMPKSFLKTTELEKKMQLMSFIAVLSGHFENLLQKMTFSYCYKFHICHTFQIASLQTLNRSHDNKSNAIFEWYD